MKGSLLGCLFLLTFIARSLKYSTIFSNIGSAMVYRLKLFIKILISFLIFSSFALGNTPEQCDEIINNAIQERNNRDYTKSLELLSQAKIIAEQNNWDEQRFRAINNIGAAYYSMSDFGEALSYYLEAYSIAIDHLTSKQEITALNNIAILYFDEQNFKRAEEYFQKAYSIAKNENLDSKIALYAVNLGNSLNRQQKFQEALKYYDEAVSSAGEDKIVWAHAFLGKGEILFLQKKYTQSETVLTELLKHTSDISLRQAHITSLITLSQIHQQKGLWNESLNLALEAQRKSVSLEQKIQTYEQLFSIYKNQRDIDNSILYKDSVMWAKDSLNSVKNTVLFENNKVKFEIQNYQKELSESQQKLESERKIFLITLALSSVALIFLIWALWNNSIKYKQKKIISERNQQITKLEFEKEIESKNRKLTAKAIHLSSKNELIQDLIDTFSNEPEIIQSASIRGKINSLQNHLKKENELDDFFTHFEEANRGFISSVKFQHPDLNSNDLRFLAYVYMDLSIKEISSLLNITMDACRKRKERISRKMEIEDTSLLYNYLHSFVK